MNSNRMFHNLDKVGAPEKEFQKFFLNFAEITLKRDFLACPLKLRMREDLWMPGRPDNIKGMETSICVDFTGPRERVGVDDISGTTYLNLLCQVNKIIKIIILRMINYNNPPKKERKNKNNKK
jgi:hypothetical protein